MTHPDLPREVVAAAVLTALREDLGAEGDITSDAVIPEVETGRAVIVAKARGVLAGVPLAKECFSRVNARFRARMEDGDTLEPGSVVAHVGGALRAILAAERTALNFLGRLSGVATTARAFVEAVRGTDVEVRDTRKTTPGLRVLEKYASAVGGAVPHRTGLFDGVLVKDNHVTVAGSVAEAVRRAREARPGVRLICEVESPEQADEAVEAGADEVMLDNMDPDAMREAVRRVAGRALVEASGGVTLETAAVIAATGVDALSAGAITHAAPWLDLSLEVQETMELPALPEED